MNKGDTVDPRGLIAESYAIEGISIEDCRTIFMDWALSHPVDSDTGELIKQLIERHGQDDHPMTQVLREGLGGMQAPRRRGGGRSRPRN